MRVISGTCRGRKLKTPSGDSVRPTTDNVKEAIFNIIASDIEGRRVLDLFAGTGQLGIEALSRGAKEAVFVDASPVSLKNVRENLQLCSLEATVIRSDAIIYLKQCTPFDLIFVDPPYASGLYEKVLECINSFDILSEGGIIIVEADHTCMLPDLSAPYHRLREYRYGKVKICTYTKESAV